MPTHRLMIQTAIAALLLTVFPLTAAAAPQKAAADCPPGSEEAATDAWLESQLSTTFALNTVLRDQPIEVDVRRRVAYLFGAVDSDIKRELAALIAANTGGVEDVQVVLEIAPDAATRKAQPIDPEPFEPGALERRLPELDRFTRAVTDATTTALVKTRLMRDEHARGIGINVDTQDSVVTLTGDVATEDIRALTVELARSTAGVARVVSHLTVGGQAEFAGMEKGAPAQ